MFDFATATDTVDTTTAGAASVQAPPAARHEAARAVIELAPGQLADVRATLDTAGPVDVVHCTLIGGDGFPFIMPARCVRSWGA